MPTNDEWRQILGPDISEKELDEFLVSLRGFIGAFLDDYFREEFDDDNFTDQPGVEPCPVSKE